MIEAAGSHSVNVKLQIGNGGTLSEAVTVNIVDLLNGTATSPADYTLTTTAVTFAAGSRDGDTRPVNLTTVVDSSLEQDETVNLRLAVAGDGVGGA